MSGQVDDQREQDIARVLRPLAASAMTRKQAELAGQLLGLHWSTIYRLRRRFIIDPVASTLKPLPRGPRVGTHRLGMAVEALIADVLTRWLPRQRQLAHPPLDIFMEVRRRCARAGLQAPARTTVGRRWAAQREAAALEESRLPSAATAPGNFVVDNPLDVVEIDHTQADVIVVDEWFRRPIGRPWLTLAIDVATRCVVGMYLSMDRPGAAAVALLLTRVVLPKDAWLSSLNVEAAWPMYGLPKMLHLDNAAEFKSKALRAGCSQYGIDLMYRPVGKPNFGGHIERLNRTLMERLRVLPGATGSSPKGRKARASEQRASLTLREFEAWLALEIAQRYHHSEHRGLMGATPVSAWDALTGPAPTRRLQGTSAEATRFLIQFLPMARRTIQDDGLTLFYVRYWHPIFVVWRVDRRSIVVRYHPEDLSRVFVSAGTQEYIEVRYADVRREPISLWEQRAAVRCLRAAGRRDVSELLIFDAIEDQRRLVAGSRSRTQRERRDKVRHDRGARQAPVIRLPTNQSRDRPPEVDYSQPAPAYNVEQW